MKSLGVAIKDDFGEDDSGVARDVYSACIWEVPKIGGTFQRKVRVREYVDSWTRIPKP